MSVEINSTTIKERTSRYDPRRVTVHSPRIVDEIETIKRDSVATGSGGEKIMRLKAVDGIPSVIVTHKYPTDELDSDGAVVYQKHTVETPLEEGKPISVTMKDGHITREHVFTRIID